MSGLRWAALLWFAYAILHVVLTGPVLDEAAIAGQVIAGQVVYAAPDSPLTAR